MPYSEVHAPPFTGSTVRVQKPGVIDRRPELRDLTNSADQVAREAKKTATGTRHGIMRGNRNHPHQHGCDALNGLGRTKDARLATHVPTSNSNATNATYSV